MTAPRRSGLLGCIFAIIRAILTVMAGAIAGGMLNIGIIKAGSQFLPPPAGVDVMDPESINANIDKYSTIDLLVPLAAHALGTLLGAFVAAALAGTRRGALRAALIIGCFFLVGGVMAVQMIPNAPAWFKAVDLGGAYIPMALIGWWLAPRRNAQA